MRTIYTVHHHPPEHPEHYVVRKWRTQAAGLWPFPIESIDDCFLRSKDLRLIRAFVHNKDLKLLDADALYGNLVESYELPAECK